MSFQHLANVAIRIVVGYGINESTGGSSARIKNGIPDIKTATRPMSPNPQIVADDVHLGAQGIRINWSSGGQHTFPYRYLRLQCGCAACVEETSGERIISVADVPEDVIIVDYIRVGRYALQFLWSDGHSTGIYPYRMLLRMAEQDEAVASST